VTGGSLDRGVTETYDTGTNNYDVTVSISVTYVDHP